MSDSELILLTGATGYVGGRLLHRLEEKGVRLRCLARNPDHLRGRVAPTTEVVKGDVLDPESLRSALRGVHTAFYLVHSMGSQRDFKRQDRAAAKAFAEAARECAVRRIIYLGGLAREGERSEHLASRHEVGHILRDSGIPTIEFRASIIIGSGSLSFEIVRGLVRRLPIMVTPRWVRSRAQPIAIEDVIDYLDQARDIPLENSMTVEIGGQDIVTYRDLMLEYARQRGLRRLILPVPALSPRLSSLWLGLVTPVHARIGRKLIESLRCDSTVTEPEAARRFDVQPRSLRESVERALTHEDREFSQTRWSDAMSSRGRDLQWGGIRLGSRFVDSRVAEVPHPPDRAFDPIERIGGKTGWYAANTLWRLRGTLDKLVGGVGLRRGRRDPDRLMPGDTVDFWRVEAVERPHLLRLRAEMKVPGRAWLQFEVEPTSGGNGSVIRQTALFDPTGLFGLLYWYALYPLHGMVFQGMLEGIARAIEEE